MAMVRKYLPFYVLLLALLTTPTAFALGLNEAKASGYVGEQSNGYLGVVNGAPASAQSLVNDINAKRREQYRAIANKNGTSLQTVEQLAGQKAIQRTPSGQYIRNASGQWVKK